MTSEERTSSFRRLMAFYVLGNGGALFVGFVASYAAILLQGAVSMKEWDFLFYFAGSRMTIQGHGSGIYNLHALGHAEAVLAYPLHVPHGVMPYVYPPYLALLLAPFAALPYDVAYILWMGVNCLLLAAAMFAFERYANLTGRTALLFRFAALASLPVLATLLLGQSSIVLLSLFTLSFFALRARRDTVAGVALAFALIKPQYVIPFVVILLVQRRWPAVAGFAGTALCLMVAPLPVLGLSTNHGYVQTMLAATHWRNQVNGFEPIWNRSFAGAMQLVLSPPQSTVATMALSLAALACLVVCTRRSRTISVPFALATIVALLISPHVLIHDLSLLLIPVGIALHHRRHGPPYLPILLICTEVAVVAGFALPLVVPVQLAVFAMCALGLWLFFTETPEEIGVPKPRSIGLRPT